MTGPTPPPLPAELEALLRRMHLPYMRRAAPEVLATARSQRWDPAEVLKVLLGEEVAGLGQLAVEAGLKVAWFSLEELGVLVRRHRADDSVSRAVQATTRSDWRLWNASLEVDRLPSTVQRSASGFWRSFGDHRTASEMGRRPGH